MNDQIKVPTSFWIISGLALLWNLMGCAIWFMEYNYWKNPEARLDLPERMQGLYDGNPGWLYVVFGIAVVTGVLGCVGLLMKKSWASTVFIISLIAILVQDAYSFFATDLIETLGIEAIGMPIVVILIAVFLIYFSRKNTANGILT